jgi:UDP-glucose 4-epimerase
MEDAVSLSGASCLVIGGAGFIGSHIVDRLLSEGAARVVVYDNFDRGDPANLAAADRTGRLHVLEGDIRDAERLGASIHGMDYVFHQASLLLLESTTDPRLALAVNVEGTLNVLLHCAQARVRKLVFASSASIFGEPDYLPVDEDHPLNNRTFYGATKIACEAMLTSLHYDRDLPFVGLRYYNVYGPRQNARGAYTQVLPRWTQALRDSEPIRINGDGRQTMDLTYVKEVARANALAATSESTNDFFNIGSGVETSVRDLATLLVSLRGSKSELVFVRHDVNLVRQRRCATAKAAERLGFSHGVPLTDGLREYLKWFDAQKLPARASA